MGPGLNHGPTRPYPNLTQPFLAGACGLDRLPRPRGDHLTRCGVCDVRF